MYRLNQVKLNINHSENDLKNKIAKTISVSVDDIEWSTLIILHKSIDARDKNNILFVYNVTFEFKDKNKVNKKLEKFNLVKFNPYVSKNLENAKRPLVVGFGPAGIFASYIFALNNMRPIIYERGKRIEDRIIDNEKFFKTMELNEESNVCFGEGGAGAFSDGKLNTNNKDKDGIYKFILETFVKFGADERILYENLPHVGTDKLVNIIKNIRDEIIKLGGEIHYNTKWSFDEKNDAPTVLAIGNSSRDTFRDLIKNGFNIKPKPFAIGYRVAHKQSLINKSQYGIDLLNEDKNSKLVDIEKILGPATYKLTYDVGNGHSVYSFCMCPGGYIINSSNFKNMLSINGMSYNDRSGEYANSAIVETITKEDITKTSDELDAALKMIEFQEMVEMKAFSLEAGFIPYITLGERDIIESEVFRGKAKYCEKLKSVYENLNLNFNINDDIEEALTHFNKIIPGFYGENRENSDYQVIVAGVETRTSSPIKLERDDNYMCNMENFYPCGEGLGHGGGIMSAAADGVRVAISIAKNSQ